MALMKYSIDTTEAAIDGPRFVEIAQRKTGGELKVTGKPDTGKFTVETEVDLIAEFVNRPRVKITEA